MPRLSSHHLALVALVCTSACASVGRSAASAADTPAPATEVPLAARGVFSCEDCNSAIPMPTEVTRALETRIANLERKGGVCSQYGAVLERSYRSGRITLRPYMWRVGSRLASGEAKPNGEMMLAREIDPLNVGVRTVDDLLRSMEHEAVHIAFDIPSGVESSEEQANGYVRACTSDAQSGHATMGVQHD